MSSDLPAMRPDSSLAMARMLVQTMHCDEAVFTRLKEDFDHPPCIRTIGQLRAAHLHPKIPVPDPPFKAYEGYRPAEVSEGAAKANLAFVEALKAERELSRITRMQAAMPDPQTWDAALRSTYLTQPRLVGKAWERAVEKAVDVAR